MVILTLFKLDHSIFTDWLSTSVRRFEYRAKIVPRTILRLSMLGELKFLTYVAGLYAAFIYWSYVQEKLTSTRYLVSGETGEEVTWNYPFALNLLMALAASLAAGLVETLVDPSKLPKISFHRYAKAALTSAIASPLGYASLKFISFPLMILAKSSKPVPVMLIAVMFFKKHFSIYKYISVLLLCGGICLFGWKNSKGGENKEFSDFCIGVGLVGLNLSLDGYTNNEQDSIFEKDKVASSQMMKNVNIWQSIYLSAYLIGGLVIAQQSNFLNEFTSSNFFSSQSELLLAIDAITRSPGIRVDLAWFCLCASVGQLLIFAVMQEYGSLVWITVSITRKILTVLISIYSFGHSMKPLQWIGLGCAGAGMLLEIVMKYTDVDGKNKAKKD